jgi:SAM-dependent methyltransferase
MWYFLSLHRHIERGLRSTLGVRPGAQILDAGCGTGGLIRRLSPQNPSWQWTGVDLSPLACESSRNRCTAEIVEASVEALPFAAERFDGVSSADVLYHVTDDRRALGEFFRVLKPGGVVVLNVPAYRWLWSYHDEAVHSQRRYGRRELLVKLREAGFINVKTTFWNTLLFPLIVIRRKCFPAPKSGSDVQLGSPLAEKIFNGLMKAEHAWLRKVGSLPFGSSIYAVARKPGERDS